MKPPLLPSTAIPECRDGRSIDGRTIEPPPALRTGTWIARGLILAIVAALAVATCHSL